jgi:sulfotransferase
MPTPIHEQTNAMLEAYFAHVDQPICIDKNRFWAEYLEMAAALVGGRDQIRSS